MHIKRKVVGNFWPIARTGTTYLALPRHEEKSSVPLITLMRDVLKVVKNRKELKKLLNEKQIHINLKIIKEPNYPVMLFDVLSYHEKYFRIKLKNKRFDVQPITKENAKHKFYKVIGKKQLQGKKIQINLSQGKNILTNQKMETGEFVGLNLENNKIEKIISLKKDVEVLVIKGKHMGKYGKIKEIIEEGENKIALIKTSDAEIKANVEGIFTNE